MDCNRLRILYKRSGWSPASRGVSGLATIDSILPICATSCVDGEKCKGTDDVLADDPFVKFYNSERGNIRCEVTPDKWQSDFRVVPIVSKP